MMFKDYLALFFMFLSLVGTWSIYVITLDRTPPVKQEFAQIQPLDLTITYCESCRRCVTHQSLDTIDFEDLPDGGQSL
jgi:hypothetical protein